MTPGEGAHIYNVTMIAPDRRGLLSKAAGVLALNSLRVHSASVNSHEGSAINTFVVSPHFGSPPAAELLRQQFILALDGDLDVIASLEQARPRRRATRRPRRREPGMRCRSTGVSAPPRILWHDGAAPGQLVVEIRTTDRAGLLAVLTGGVRAGRGRHRLGEGHHAGFLGRRRVLHRRCRRWLDTDRRQAAVERPARTRPVRGAARAAAGQAGRGGGLTRAIRANR